MARLTGSLAHAYAYTVPADPGYAQPARHDAHTAGGAVDRDNAPSGGGWQPYGWDEPVTVLTGGQWYPQGSHRGTGSHAGDAGRGAPAVRDAVELHNPDNLGGTGRHTPADLRDAGSSGAANGGLSATGVSAPWANGPVYRRRADGGVVARAGGLALGHVYVPVAEDHRQDLRFSRPKIRGVRLTSPVNERSSPNPGSIHTSMFDPIVPGRLMGPVSPRLRRIVRPYGQTDYVPVDQDPALPTGDGGGPIGSQWVR